MHGEIDPSVSRIALHYVRIIVRGLDYCIRTMLLHVSNNSVDQHRVIGIQVTIVRGILAQLKTTVAAAVKAM